MFLSIRLFGVEWLSVELERDDALPELPPCVACEDSGEPCAVCGSEPLELE